MSMDNTLGFEPLYDKILVEQVEAETKTASGIILPDVAQERHSIGRVVAVGPGYRTQDNSLHALTVQVGDRIIFGKYGGTTIDVDGVTFVIMSERDVYGILREGP